MKQGHANLTKVKAVKLKAGGAILTNNKICVIATYGGLEGAVVGVVVVVVHFLFYQIWCEFSTTPHRCGVSLGIMDFPCTVASYVVKFVKFVLVRYL